MTSLKWFEFKNLKDVPINGGNLSLKRDVEVFEDKGFEGKGKFRAKLQTLVMYLWITFCKINRVAVHDIIEGFKKGVTGCFFGGAMKMDIHHGDVVEDLRV